MANSLNKVTTKSILDATIATADIADDAVTEDKLANAINTSIAGKAVLTGSTDNTICTVTGANAIQGEANLTFDGSKLLLNTTTEGSASADDLTITSPDGTANAGITIRCGVNNAGNIYFSDATSGTGEYAGYISYAHGTAGENLTFGTDSSERVRIASDGNVQIGATAPLTSYSSSSQKLTVYKADGNGGALELGGSTNADAYNAGQIFFTNTANANDTAWQSNSKLVGLIRAETITTDSNAGDDSGADLAFYTKAEAEAGSLKMMIHGEGYVTKNKQPCSFYVGLSNSATSSKTDSTETLVFATLKRNEGGHYNGSNGRFTAPVAGTYFVGINILVDYNASLESRACTLQKNGSNYATLAYHKSGGESRYEGMAGTGIIELAANDYISIHGTAGLHTGGETSFTVYLLG